MSSTTQSGGASRTFPTGHTIDQYRVVSLNTSGQVITATATDANPLVGVTTRKVVTAGDPASIQLINGGGTGFVELHATVTNPSTAIYSGADGKASPTATGGLIGVALQGGVAGDVVEVLFGSTEL